MITLFIASALVRIAAIVDRADEPVARIVGDDHGVAADRAHGVANPYLGCLAHDAGRLARVANKVVVESHLPDQRAGPSLLGGDDPNGATLGGGWWDMGARGEREQG